MSDMLDSNVIVDFSLLSVFLFMGIDSMHINFFVMKGTAYA